MNIKLKTPKRLVINLTDEEHQQIKIAATLRNISIRQYVLQAILEKMINDPQ